MSGASDRKTMLGRTLAPSSKVTRILQQQTRGKDSRGTFDRYTRAVLFSDIVGSTSFFERRGDEAGMAMVERHNRVLFPVVESNKGYIVKTIGDAIMASYAGAEEAVRSAVAMQEALKSHNASQAEEDRIAIRIGINFGEVIIKENDLFGDVVNAAARVESLARGGMILVSDAVEAELKRTSSDLEREPFDAVLVKGKQEPLQVYIVPWDPDAPEIAPGRIPELQSGELTGGRFKIISRLGEGGMGRVYHAIDKALEEGVALKFIRSNLAADPGSLDRFKQEVKLARTVTHRNICRIHEFLQMEGRTFISMELIRGHPLSEIIEQRAPLPPQELLRIAAGICAGLHEAHARGVTHRDLKPANVMIEENSKRVVITDFGIARLASTGEKDEGGELVVGTPEYMSPEQAQGLEVGPAGDIYSLGVMLYEMSTGKLPHTAPTPVEVAAQQVSSKPQPPRKHNPDIPETIEAVILRCMSKNPKKRFTSAKEVARALGIETRAEIQRGKAVLWAGLALLAVLVLVIVFVLPASPAGPSGPRVLRHLISSQAVENQARWAPDGTKFAFIRDNDVWVSSFPDISPQRMTEGASVLRSSDLAGLAWSSDGESLLAATGGENSDPRIVRVGSKGGDFHTVIDEASAPDLSADGLKLAFVRENEYGGTDILVSGTNGSEQRVVLAGDYILSYLQPRWSPDGRSLAVVLNFVGYSSTRDIGVFDVESGEFLRLTEDGEKQRACNVDPAWSAKGKWIVYSSKRTGTMSLWAVPADGGKSVGITQGATEDQRNADVAPDGSLVLFNTASRRLDIATMALKSGKVSRITDDVWVDRFPVWSPKRERIAFRSQRSSEDPSRFVFVIYDRDVRAEEIIDAPGGLRDFSWCGEDRLLYAQTLGDDRRLGTLELGGVKHRILASGYHRLWTPSADPACKRIVFAAQKEHADPRRLWTVELKGGDARKLHEEPGREVYPSFSPDGKWIAYRWAPSREHLGEAVLKVVSADGERTRTICNHTSFNHSRRRIRWSPDGRWLFYMESTPAGASLWKVRFKGGKPRKLVDVTDIHTFDFDLSPGAEMLVYPKASYTGDIFALEDIEW